MNLEDQNGISDPQGVDLIRAEIRRRTTVTVLPDLLCVCRTYHPPHVSHSMKRMYTMIVFLVHHCLMIFWVASSWPESQCLRSSESSGPQHEIEATFRSEPEEPERRRWYMLKGYAAAPMPVEKFGTTKKRR